MRNVSTDFEVFSTCPQSSRHVGPEYLDRVARTAQWSERHGYTGMLIYSDHSLVDPWLVTSEVIRATSELCPLVAVQPANMHPHTVAKLISSFAFLYSRRIHLNMIAGGFRGDLNAIGDPTPHDQRYERLREFTEIVLELTAGETVTKSGDWYQVQALTLAPAVPDHLRPGVLMSGSSAAGLATASALGAIAVQYPQPPGETSDVPGDVDTGIRVGIVARETSEHAWLVAHERFPPTRRGELLHEIAMSRSDSRWHSTLSQLAEESASQGSAYWLGPFKNYDTFCPYLVGSYDEVAAEVVSYWDDGHRTVILDIPPSEEECDHTDVVFDRVRSLLGRRADP